MNVLCIRAQLNFFFRRTGTWCSLSRRNQKQIVCKFAINRSRSSILWATCLVFACPRSRTLSHLQDHTYKILCCFSHTWPRTNVWIGVCWPPVCRLARRKPGMVLVAEYLNSKLDITWSAAGCWSLRGGSWLWSQAVTILAQCCAATKNFLAYVVKWWGSLGTSIEWTVCIQSKVTSCSCRNRIFQWLCSVLHWLGRQRAQSEERVSRSRGDMWLWTALGKEVSEFQIPFSDSRWFDPLFGGRFFHSLIIRGSIAKSSGRVPRSLGTFRISGSSSIVFTLFVAVDCSQGA